MLELEALKRVHTSNKADNEGAI